jgi:hypothetical protein
MIGVGAGVKNPPVPPVANKAGDAGEDKNRQKQKQEQKQSTAEAVVAPQTGGPSIALRNRCVSCAWRV